jgi:hypothetical protein
MERADDARVAQSAVDGDPRFLQHQRDDGRSSLFLEAKFRMRVQIATQGDEERKVVVHGMDHPVYPRISRTGEVSSVPVSASAIPRFGGGPNCRRASPRSRL